MSCFAIIPAATPEDLEKARRLEPAFLLYQSLGFREIEPYYENPLEGVVYLELDLRRFGELFLPGVV